MLSAGTQKALCQYARDHALPAPTKEVFDELEYLLSKAGEQSQSRKMMYCIGAHLLYDTVHIVAPSCPDYSHTNGIYNLNSASGGVPLLAQLHIRLLEEITKQIPRINCEIVIADQETDDEVLCACIKNSRSEFRAKIQASVRSTVAYLKDKGMHCRVGLMTERFPELRAREAFFVEEIARNPAYSGKIKHDTVARRDMYIRLGVSDPVQQQQRTVRTAAQYCSLAEISVHHRFLVCNHETVNLSWYNRHNAAVLHNAISIY